MLTGTCTESSANALRLAESKGTPHG